MPKIVLTKPTSGFNLAAINANFTKIETEFQNKVAYRNNPVGEPNNLETNLDVNGKRLYNLGAPEQPSDAIRLYDLNTMPVGNAVAAAISAAEAKAARDDTLNRYRGALAGDPALRPDGTANQVGDEYFDTTMGLLKRWTGVIWQASDLNTANLAAPTGARLIGYAAKAANAVTKSAEEKMRERVSVTDFCANGIDGAAVDPTGVLDSTLGLQAARNYVAANATRVKLVFPSGIYKYSVSPNWAIQDAHIEAEGEVRLRYTGTGNAVILDAGGAGGDLIYNTKMFDFIVESPNTASNGVFVRSVHHGELGFNVRGCGTTSAALLVKFAVCTIFRKYTTSVNEEGWYNSGSGQAKPAIGINLDIRNPGEFVSYCTFYTPIVEGPPIGIQLTGTLGNVFIGGTSEACATYGVFATTGANLDRFIGVDFEANGLADVFNNGDDVSFIDCDSAKLIAFGSSCKRGVVRGGLHNDVLFDAGSIGCIADHFYVNRLLDDLGTFTDAGTNSSVLSVRDCSPALNTYLTGTFAFTGVVGILAGGTTTATVTVRGCKTTDVVMANLVGETSLFTHSARVSAAETVVVTFKNETGGVANLSAGTIKVIALRP